MTRVITVIAELRVVKSRTVAAEGKESDELQFTWDEDPDKPMKYSKQSTHFAGLLTIALLTGAGAVLPLNLHAAEAQAQAQQTQAVTERLFASPDEAVKALQKAVEAHDKTALAEIFGPEYDELLTGDKVQDANNGKRFASALAEGCNPVKEGDDKITLEIGTNNWPMPIPLTRAGGQWHFDTAAGKDEIINRHIGKDELHAIGVCRAYVIAQRQYAGMDPDAHFAQKFKSSPGKKDGLYWEATGSEAASPFGPLVAEAHLEGYVNHNGSGSHPFHGYYFRILTRQGQDAAGGKMNYISHGNMTGGFALVAYPEEWNKSGIMTFIVNQDGKVYQRNFGEKTCQIARAMKGYDPDSESTLVSDNGVASAALER